MVETLRVACMYNPYSHIFDRAVFYPQTAFLRIQNKSGGLGAYDDTQRILDVYSDRLCFHTVEVRFIQQQCTPLEMGLAHLNQDLGELCAVCQRTAYI